jgi:uncharacterized membrane protein YfcA
MEYGLIAISVFVASLITFYSGFGLGTIVMPVLALFVPLPIAIALTAVVHLFHNACKACLLCRSIVWPVVFRFGVSAAFAAIPGALLLFWLSQFHVLYSYSIGGISGKVSLLHSIVGLLLIFFAAIESLPYKKMAIQNLAVGGAISGFFGGLSGNQGAFRSLFLLHTDLTARSFIATNACIALFVDSVRLIVYGVSFSGLLLSSNETLLAVAMSSSIAGIAIGMTLLQRATSRSIQKFVVALLYLFGALLVVGII